MHYASSLHFNLAEQDRQLDKLPCADDAAFTSQLWEQQPRCLPNTRVQLLKMVETWSDNPNSPCIFWLKGMAGTGKSTVARTVADKYAMREQLVTSFFFSRGRGDLGYAKKFFTTIAAQLANVNSSLRHYISKAIAENPQIIREGLKAQWDQLIYKPLANWGQTLSQPQALIVIIDALDECEGEDDVRLLLQLLPQMKNLQIINVRIFVTSRPDTPIRLGFRQMSKDIHQDLALHDIDKVITQQDIYVFLVHEFQNIQQDFDLHRGWSSDQDIKLLANRASGLFIYAATACRYIRNARYNRTQALTRLLGSSTAPTAIATLDKMYLQVLESSILRGSEGHNEELIGMFRKITGPIVVLSQPLSTLALAKLIDIPEQSALAVLGDLQSVLEVPESPNRPIQLLHPSFRDFLLDEDRESSYFHIDKRSTHESLANDCIRVMSNHLKKDMCDLKAPGTLASEVTSDQIEQCLTLELRYACQYWAMHLLKSEIQLHHNDQISNFLNQHLLHWLETMSLIGKTSEGVLAISSLENMVIVCNIIHSQV